MEQRGVTLRIVNVLTDSVAAGSVLSTAPGPGLAVSSEVLIEVAERPVLRSLADFELIERDCGGRSVAWEVGDAEVNGDVYPRSIVWERRLNSVECFAEFNLSRDWRSFRGLAGLDDQSLSASSARFEILVDGVSLFRESVVIGQAIPFDIDVTDGLRLRIITTRLVEGEMANWVWATPELVGEPGVVE